MVFDHQIVLFHQNVKDTEDALRTMSKLFIAEGLAEAEFTDGILNREKVFPTGLRLENGTGVAIPHTDCDKVIRSQIGFMSLNQPVIFQQMGGEPEDQVEVRMIFMLCLKEAHEQLDTLQNLMNLFQNSEQMEELYQCSDIETYKKIIAASNLF
jgi:PTS system galactitol-specific IIA component